MEVARRGSPTVPDMAWPQAGYFQANSPCPSAAANATGEIGGHSRNRGVVDDAMASGAARQTASAAGSKSRSAILPPGPTAVSGRSSELPVAFAPRLRFDPGNLCVPPDRQTRQAVALRNDNTNVRLGVALHAELATQPAMLVRGWLASRAGSTKAAFGYLRSAHLWRNNVKA